jgi:hypothetical protein
MRAFNGAPWSESFRKSVRRIIDNLLRPLILPTQFTAIPVSASTANCFKNLQSRFQTIENSNQPKKIFDRRTYTNQYFSLATQAATLPNLACCLPKPPCFATNKCTRLLALPRKKQQANNRKQEKIKKFLQSSFQFASLTNGR